MEEKHTLTILDENGVQKEAELLSTLKLEDKEYAIYSIDNEDETANIYAAELIENEDGTKDFKEIEDENIREEITKVINDIINK